MAKIVYPLTQVLEVKNKRVEDAERVLKDKLHELEKEKEKLRQKEEERDRVLNHHDDKLRQMRAAMDEKEVTSPKIQQMKAYLKVVKEKLKVEEKKVSDQQKQVEVAEKNVEVAREDLNKKRQEVEKLVIHRKDWEREMAKEMELIDGREHDEIGNIIYGLHHHNRDKH